VENFLCKKQKIFLTLCVFCSISSKLLLAGFCRFLPETKGNAAKILPQDFPKNPPWLGNDSLTFPLVIFMFFFLFH
jgi:hypothetical protein